MTIERGPPHPTARLDRRRATTMGAPRADDRTFLQRIVHANSVQAELMKSSRVKLCESLKLLAEIDILMRR